MLEKFNKIKGIGLLGSIFAFGYSLIKGSTQFWRGYHNIDISFNFLNLGYTTDVTTSGAIIKLQEAYLMGLNQIREGFGWFAFACILGLIVGFSLRSNLKSAVTN